MKHKITLILAVFCTVQCLEASALGTDQQKLEYAKTALSSLLAEKGQGLTLNANSLKITKCTGVVDGIGGFLDNMRAGGKYECRVVEFQVTDKQGKTYSGSLPIDTETLTRTEIFRDPEKSTLPKIDGSVKTMRDPKTREDFYIGYHFMSDRSITGAARDQVTAAEAFNLVPASPPQLSSSANQKRAGVAPLAPLKTGTNIAKPAN